MSTLLYDSPVFGPVQSRRLGLSLGINLMPSDGKACTFNCVYCECGLNGVNVPTQKRPTAYEVYESLKAKLIEMQEEGQLPDVITFAGNGEPTSHPGFAHIIEDTLLLRSQFCPEAKVSVLSNGTYLHRPDVIDALKLVDYNIIKLDTVDPILMRRINQPVVWCHPKEQILYLQRFNGRVIIQTLFLKGTVNGEKVNNMTEKYVRPWLNALKKIAPRQVMLYTIARETPYDTLEKASPADLDHIAARVEELGIHATVSY